MQALSQLSYTPAANMKLYEAGRASANRAPTASGTRALLRSAIIRHAPLAKVEIPNAMPLPSPRDPVEVDLSGRAILVTGASGGLGRPLAIACARRGATVVLHGRVVRKLEAIYDEIVAAGSPQPTILPLDLAVASADDFGQVAGAIRAQLGRLDGLVHTAAFLGSLGPIEHQSFDAGRRCCASI